jgi:hypothetical protein
MDAAFEAAALKAWAASLAFFNPSAMVCLRSGGGSGSSGCSGGDVGFMYSVTRFSACFSLAALLK